MRANGPADEITERQLFFAMDMISSDSFYIVVDGGGTKTAVTLISDQDEQHFKGYGGPANIFSLSKAKVLTSIITGIEDALKKRLEFYGPQGVRSPTKAIEMNVHKLCVGLAGAFSVDRDKLAETRDLLQNLFLSVDSITLSSDLSLLPLANPKKENTKYCIALIAGTGSSSFCFKYSPKGDLELLGRSGGWGPQLGDSGAGYSIGIRAIKSTLTAIDQYNILQSLNKSPTLKSIHKDIFYSVTEVEHNSSNTSQFFKAIDGLFADQSTLGDTRKQIASLTRPLFEALEATDGSQTVAQSILQQESLELVHLLKTFTEVIDPTETTLVVSGSLFLLSAYYQLFCTHLKASQIGFKDIAVIHDPSVSVISQIAK